MIIVAAIICGAFLRNNANLELDGANSHRLNFNAELQFILAYGQLAKKWSSTLRSLNYYFNSISSLFDE